MAEGRVAQVLGGVVDVEFPPDNLPAIYDALEVPREDNKPLILEVQKHLGKGWVRCVAMDSTDGLQRGRKAISNGRPISVPVGIETLGRVFDVLGQPVDGLFLPWYKLPITKGRSASPASKPTRTSSPISGIK